MDSRYKSVTHVDDLDGILSMLYAKHKYNIDCEGGLSFDSCEMWVMATPTTLRIYLDIGIIRDGEKCIDHHLYESHVKKYNKDNVNPHDLKTMFDGNIKTKFPLGNIIWMLHLFKDNVENFTETQCKILIASDATYRNYQKYKDNVIRWLKFLKMNYLIELLERIPISEFERVHSQFDLKLKVDHEYNWLESRSGTDAQYFIDELAYMMNWNTAKLPQINYVYDLETSSNGSVDNWNENTLTHYKLNNSTFLKADILKLRKVR